MKRKANYYHGCQIKGTATKRATVKATYRRLLNKRDRRFGKTECICSSELAR